MSTAEPRWIGIRDGIIAAPTINKAIRILHDESDMGLYEFARFTGVNSASVSRIEMGHTPPAYVTLLRICKAFDMAATIYPDGRAELRPARERSGQG